MAVGLVAYRMWAISYAKRRSKYVLAEYNTHRQTLLLAQFTYCAKNV